MGGRVRRRRDGGGASRQRYGCSSPTAVKSSSPPRARSPFILTIQTLARHAARRTTTISEPRIPSSARPPPTSSSPSTSGLILKQHDSARARVATYRVADPTFGVPPTAGHRTARIRFGARLVDAATFGFSTRSRQRRARSVALVGGRRQRQSPYCRLVAQECRPHGTTAGFRISPRISAAEHRRAPTQ